jgi:hypothetical protein
MERARTIVLIFGLGVAAAGLLASDAVTVGIGLRERTAPAQTKFVEVRWPFLRDQWGEGRAFRCAVADCGIEVQVFVRPKIGFCNCDTGVSDDAELDRVGDLELYSDRFVPLADGHEVRVGWMTGRSRPYEIELPLSQRRVAQALAFNQNCDVMVATVAASREDLAQADRLALQFLNSEPVLQWARKEFGL